VVEDFRNSVISGFKWVGLLNGSLFATRFIVNLILAALLLPEDFGLIAIVNVFTEILVVIADMGFNAAVIQKKEINKSHLSTAFFLNLLLSVFLVVIIILTSGFIARFYNEQQVQELLNIFSVVIIIRAVSSVQLAMLDRNLNFKKLAIISFLALILGAGLKIVMAYWGFGAKSIVYGEVLYHSLISIILWISSSWRPNLSLISKQSFHDLFGFGSNIMITNVLGNLSRKADIMIIGKLVAASSLGLYSMAFMISSFMMSLINNIIQKVIFPGFSRIQNDLEHLRSSYLVSVRYVTLISLPFAVGLIFVAWEFVGIFLDDKWKDIVPIVQLLGLFAASNALGGVLWGQVIKAIGKSGLVLRMTIVRLIAIVGFIIVGSNWGLIGIATAMVFFGWILRFTYQYITNRMIKIKMMAYLNAVFPGVLCSLVMSVLLLIVEYFRQQYFPNLFISLGIKLIIGGGSYILVFRFIFAKHFLNLKKAFI